MQSVLYDSSEHTHVYISRHDGMREQFKLTQPRNLENDQQKIGDTGTRRQIQRELLTQLLIFFKFAHVSTTSRQTLVEC